VGTRGVERSQKPGVKNQSFDNMPPSYWFIVIIPVFCRGIYANFDRRAH
jgi:hypothetical protein